LDGQVARPDSDPDLADLLDKFVCVRVVQAWGLDLSLFQFDDGLTWSVFLMNADRTIYGRYGSLSPGKAAARDVTLEGFKKALQGALELHAAYPANKSELAGKKGPPAAWGAPEQIPALKGKASARNSDGTRASCVHCHQVGEAELWSRRSLRQPIRDDLLWRYPMPDSIGLTLDPVERATVTAIRPGSAAERAGFRTGDRIAKLDGQPVISIADVQWVLHTAKVPGTVKAEVTRDGRSVPLQLSLSADWRRGDEFTWRASTRDLRYQVTGTERLEPLPADERTRLSIPDGKMALRVSGIAPDWFKARNPSGRNLKKGDIVLAVDAKRDLATESLFYSHLLQDKAPGQGYQLTVLRDGKPQQVAMTLP